MGLLIVTCPIHRFWSTLFHYFFSNWQKVKSYHFPFSITKLNVLFSNGRKFGFQLVESLVSTGRKLVFLTGRKFGASSEVLPCYFRLNPGTQPEWWEEMIFHQTALSPPLHISIYYHQLYYHASHWIPLHISIDSRHCASTTQPPAHHSHLCFRKRSNLCFRKSSHLCFRKAPTCVSEKTSFHFKNLNPSVLVTTQGTKQRTTPITLRNAIIS